MHETKKVAGNMGWSERDGKMLRGGGGDFLAFILSHLAPAGRFKNSYNFPEFII